MKYELLRALQLNCSVNCKATAVGHFLERNKVNVVSQTVSNGV